MLFLASILSHLIFYIQVHGCQFLNVNLRPFGASGICLFSDDSLDSGIFQFAKKTNNSIVLVDIVARTLNCSPTSPWSTLLSKKNLSIFRDRIQSTVSILKFGMLFPSCCQIKYWLSGWNSQNACQNSKQGSSLIWVCALCLGLFVRQLMFKFLEHLL